MNEEQEAGQPADTPPNTSALYIAYNLLAVVLLVSLSVAIVDLFKSKNDGKVAARRQSGGGGGIRRVPARRASTIGLPIPETRSITFRRSSGSPRIAEEQSQAALSSDWSERARIASPAGSRRNCIVVDPQPTSTAPFRPRSRSVAAEAVSEDVGERQQCRRMSASCFPTPVAGSGAFVSEDGIADLKLARRIRVLRHR